MINLLLVLRLIAHTGQFLTSVDPGDFGRTPRITGDHVSPNAVRWRDIPGASVPDPAAFAPKITGPTDQFLALRTCSPGRHLQGMGPGDFGETQNHQRPSLTKCRPLPRNTVHSPAAFGPKAHLPHRSILGRFRMLPGKAFESHGSRRLRRDP